MYSIEIKDKRKKEIKDKILTLEILDDGFVLYDEKDWVVDASLLAGAGDILIHPDLEAEQFPTWTRFRLH